MRKIQSPILDAEHDTAKGLRKAGVSTVQKWEIGHKKPTVTALKLLHLVQKRGLEVVAG